MLGNPEVAEQLAASQRRPMFLEIAITFPSSHF
jgi:hypothetical protein